jgi:hypothetical protein
MGRRFDELTQLPVNLTLPHGRRLTSPSPTTARSLKVGDWVLVNDRPAPITEIRFRRGRWRVIHLRGRPPLRVSVRAVLVAYRQTH